MKFNQSPNSPKRVIAVPENDKEAVWLMTTKHKSIRKGDERYVIAALRRWLQTPEAENAEATLVELKEKIANDLVAAMTEGPKTMPPQQQHQHNVRLQYGDIISRANELSLKRHMGPFVVDIKGDVAVVRHCQTLKCFVGENPKRARAQLARKFVEVYSK